MQSQEIIALLQKREDEFNRIVLKFKPKLYYLLLVYCEKRNYTNARNHINEVMGLNLHPGKTIPRYTDHLIEWGLVERINPNSSDREGCNHKITDKGKLFLEFYEAKIKLLRVLNIPLY